jgi:hypothetical protein
MVGGDRQVDLAGDDQQRQREREQALLAEVEGAVSQRIRRHEAVEPQAEAGEQQHQQGQQHTLPEAEGVHAGTSRRSRIKRPLRPCAPAFSTTDTEDHHTGNRLLPEGRDLDHRQRAVHHADEQHAQRGSGHRCPHHRRCSRRRCTQAAITVSS